jgi:hypothetical protein
LYEKFGFETVKERELSVPEDVGPSPGIKIWTMVRKRRTE